MDALIERRRPSRTRRPLPRRKPLVTRRQQRLFLLLAVLLLVAGATAGLAALVRPAPLPRFVGLWILGDVSQQGQRDAARTRDRAALIDGHYFKDVRLLPPGTPTLRQVEVQLTELQSLRRREAAVLYVAASATLDAAGRVQLPLGSGVTSSTLALRDALVALRDSPARRKLLVLDLARGDADAIWPKTFGAVAAAVLKEVGEVDDPQRLVLTSHAPGETPCICELQGRTLFSTCLEEGLRGDADGALDHRCDGRVSVAELAAFVKRMVAQRALATQAASQHPLFFGDGRDFDLAAIALRSHHRQTAAAKPAAARAYPKWLAAAWTARDQMIAAGKLEQTPRLWRRWEETLLHAEGQWRGGRAEAEVQRDLTQNLAALTRAIQQFEAAVPTPTPHSLAALRLAGEPQDLPAARKAVDDLLAAITAKTAGLPVEKAVIVRQGLMSEFLDKTQKLDSDALSMALVDRLMSDEAPTPAAVQLCDQLLRVRQPQPCYVETEFVRRLATTLAAYPNLSTAIVAQSLRVVRKGELASSPVRTFAETRLDLQTATQRRYDGEYLLLRPGFAQATAAAESLRAAEQTYDRVLAASATYDEAFRTLGRAMLRLPVGLNELPPNPKTLRAWATAAGTASELGDAIHATASNSQQHERTEQIRSLTLRTAAAVDEVFEPWSVEQLNAQIATATGDAKFSAAWPAMEAALRWPGLAAADRLRLWQAFDALNVRLQATPAATALTRQQDDSLDRVAISPNLAASDAIVKARCAAALLQFGGVGGPALAAVQIDLRRIAARHAAGESIAESELQQIEQTLRSNYAQLLSGVNLGNSPWARVRAACIVPAQREVPWLDAIDRNPYVAWRRELETARWTWLAGEFQYRAHDDTVQFNGDIARRYAMLVGSVDDSYLQIDAPSQLERPSSVAPQSSAAVHWQWFGRAPAPGFQDVKVFSPTAGIALQGERVFAAGDGATIKLVLNATGDATLGSGIVVALRAAERTWHRTVPFDSTGGCPLQLLLATSPQGEALAVDVLRLRPATTPQSRYLFIKNPTATPQQIFVDVVGVGQAMVSAAANSVTPVVYPPSATPGVQGVAIQGAMEVRMCDGANKQTLLTQQIPIEVVSPAQYTRVVETRFEPSAGGKNRLSITLAASLMPPGPPCIVDLVLSPERIPGLVGVTGGRLRGELLRDGTPLTLTAEGLQLIDGVDELGEFALDVDGVERALTFVADFARRGDATTPRQVARPTISLTANQYVLAGPNFRPTSHVTQGPSTARIELRVGRLEGDAFVTQLSQKSPSPRETWIDASPAKDGAIALNVGLRDWQFAFDATGLVGPRTVEAALIDASGRRLTVARQQVVFDGTPPESLTYFQLPRETLAGTPLNVQVLAADTLSGIDKVSIFVGEPVNGQPPAGAQLMDAARSPDGGFWIAQLPPQKELGPVKVGAMAVNRVGLATCIYEAITIVDQLAAPGGSIAGTVSEGSLPQPRLTVELHDDKNAVIATMKTDGQGEFRFNGIKPGNYAVIATKPASQRQAKGAAAVQASQTTNVALQLSLQSG